MSVFYKVKQMNEERQGPTLGVHFIGFVQF